MDPIDDTHSKFPIFDNASNISQKKSCYAALLSGGMTPVGKPAPTFQAQVEQDLKLYPDLIQLEIPHDKELRYRPVNINN